MGNVLGRNDPIITLDGASYSLVGLPQTTHDLLKSVAFVRERLQHLQGDLAVSQTAHVACARALKEKLIGIPGV